MESNGPPSGSDFLATQIARLHVEVAGAYDQIRAQAAAHVAKDQRIAELEAEVVKLKEPKEGSKRPDTTLRTRCRA